MKTKAEFTRPYLENVFYLFDEVEHLTEELLIFIRNNKQLNSTLIESRRTKIHSIAWRSMFLYADFVDNSLSKQGYYVSSPQMKAFILNKWAMGYQRLLAPLCKELSKIREDYLK